MTAREIWKLGYRAGRVRGQTTGRERYVRLLSSTGTMTSSTAVRALLMPSAMFIDPPRTRTLWQRITRRQS